MTNSTSDAEMIQRLKERLERGARIHLTELDGGRWEYRAFVDGRPVDRSICPSAGRAARWARQAIRKHRRNGWTR